MKALPRFVNPPLGFGALRERQIGVSVTGIRLESFPKFERRLGLIPFRRRDEAHDVVGIRRICAALEGELDALARRRDVRKAQVGDCEMYQDLRLFFASFAGNAHHPERRLELPGRFLRPAELQVSEPEMVAVIGNLGSLRRGLGECLEGRFDVTLVVELDAASIGVGGRGLKGESEKDRGPHEPL